MFKWQPLVYPVKCFYNNNITVIYLHSSQFVSAKQTKNQGIRVKNVYKLLLSQADFQQENNSKTQTVQSQTLQQALQ
jgi:hypothetical protein